MYMVIINSSRRIGWFQHRSDAVRYLNKKYGQKVQGELRNAENGKFTCWDGQCPDGAVLISFWPDCQSAERTWPDMEIVK